MITVCSRYYIERVTVENLEEMMSQVDRAAREVASARVDVIAQCGTPGVFIRGFGYDKELIDRIQKATGVQATTMASSVVESLRRLGVQRIVVGTAYTDNLNALLKRFLEDSGFTVVSIAGLGLVSNVEIGDQSPQTAYRFGRRLCAAAGPTERYSSLAQGSAPLRRFRRSRKTSAFPLSAAAYRLFGMPSA